MNADAEHGPGFYSGPPVQVPAGGFDAVRYLVRRTRTVHLELDETPWRWFGADFTEEPQAAEGPPVPLAQVPEDLKRAVEAEIKWVKQFAGPGG